MPITELTDASAVLSAMDEFDTVGRDAFLQNHGYEVARRYFVFRDQKQYDSKAIAGVAYGYQYPDRGPLKATEFSGGEATVKAVLEQLDYVVQKVTGGASSSEGSSEQIRNPPWSRDELIIALDIYVRFNGQPPSKTSPEILEFSSVLNRLNFALWTSETATLRNVNGVYMKLMNFRRFDPVFKEAGRSGLTRGNRLEQEVWEDFHSAPVRLANVAQAIRQEVDRETEKAPNIPLPSPYVLDDDFEALEGRILTAVHVRRERNRELVKRKKAQVLAKYGKLACEVCNFDFAKIYGERGTGFIECHHTKPVEALADGATTKISDLALLCSNCHRMVHARRPWLEISELKAQMNVGL